MFRGRGLVRVGSMSEDENVGQLEGLAMALRVGMKPITTEKRQTTTNRT